jgi:hypothetical protein
MVLGFSCLEEEVLLDGAVYFLDVLENGILIVFVLL